MAPILTNGEQKTKTESADLQASDFDSFFDTKHIKSDLKRRSVHGGMFTMVSYGSSFVIRTASTIILARLLTPQDYGIIAMVTAITNFVMMFKDMGLSMATIQKAEINHRQVSTLFWINLAAGLGLTLLTLALAPAIAWFYGEPRLIWITIFLAGVFLFAGLTIQHQALLRRQMRFGTLAVIEISSSLAGVLAAIIAAYYGAGFWALVLMQLVIPAGNAVGVWIACRWRPGLPVRKSGIRSMVHFGLNVTAFNITNYFCKSVDQILIGRFFGSGILGLYNRAYQLLMWPVSYIRVPLTLVAIPALSHIQKDPVRFRRYYTKLVSIVALVSMPLMVYLVICSYNVIRLLLGQKWLGACIIFKIMAVTGFIIAIGGTTGLVQVSLGRSSRYFKWGLYSGIAAIISYVAGLPWGAVGVATSYAIGSYLIFLPSLWYCFRFTPISVMTFMSAIWRPVTAGFCMATIIYPIYRFLANQSDILVAGLCFFLGGIVYIAALLLIPGGKTLLMEFWQTLTLIFPQKSKLSVIK